MTKKLLLTFALLLTAVTGAFADDSGSWGEDVSYSYVESTHTLTISGTGAMADYEGPSDQPWKDYRSSIKTVVIGAGVTTIGGYAFNGCSNLTSITIPASVTSIGESAFAGCEGLTSIEIPASVTSIGGYAFEGCSGLTTVSFAAGSQLETIGGNAFNSCSDLTSITIPASVTSISADAFVWCSKLETMTVEDGNKVYDSRNGCNAIIEKSSNTLIRGCNGSTIPDGVTIIGEGAFANCEGLTSITIPASVTTIGEIAFEGCLKLATVTVYAPSCTLGDLAFESCPELTIYVLSDLVDYYKDADNWKNYADKIEGISTPNGNCGENVRWVLTGEYPNYTLTITGTGAMADYDNDDEQPLYDSAEYIKTIFIGAGVTNIVDNAFEFCGNLRSVSFAAGSQLKTIGNYAFANTGLTSIEIPASVTTIEYGAFIECSGLTSITIPANVTTIGDYAFESCTGLASITLAEGLTTIGGYAFYNCGTTIESVTIPESVTSIGENAFNGTNVTNFYINNIPSKIAIGETPFKADGVTIHVFTQMQSTFENATNWSAYTGHFNADIAISHVQSITLDNESMIMKTNTSGKLNATINPADARVKDVVFTSSNDNIIHITNAATGEFITGAKYDNATATITCTAMDGSGKYASCTVTVTVQSGFTPAESVTLNKKNMSIEVGNTFQLFATISPTNTTYKYVTWRSSDENVATVDNTGNVTAIAPGVATITAISHDGQARANCEVTVDDSGSCGTGVTWTLTGTSPNYTLTISGTGAIQDAVGGSMPWNSYKSSITTLIIEDGVTSIGEQAFDGCSSLNSVTIPASVTTIGMYAFQGCNSLTSIEIPSGVTSIGNFAFDGCTDLTSIEIPSGVTSIGINPFCGCSGLESISVAFGNTKYDSRNKCNAIIEKETNKLIVGCKNSFIPYGVTTIGMYAFYGCNSLTSIEIPSGVTSIGNFAFDGCTDLTSIEIPASVTSIGINPFYGCSGLESISVAFGNTKYDSRNKCNAIIETETNTLITGCKNSFIPYGVTTIGEDAFGGCEGLTSIEIPASVTTIGEDAFGGCEGLTSITIPASVTTIGDYAFVGTVLTSITIPASVTSIGNYAFADCTSLSSVTIYAPSLSYYGYEAFSNNNAEGRKIYVFENCMDYYKAQASKMSVNANDIEAITGINLKDNDDNSTLIAAANDNALNVTLKGRTLYKDGDWNTLCLPFSLGDAEAADGHHFDGTPLEGADVMTLNSNDSGLSGTTLTLNFSDAPATIPAGTPFIVKWGDKDEPSTLEGLTDLTAPVFTGVTIEKDLNDVTSTDGTVSFKGSYASITYTEENKSILFVGGENSLYWPTAGSSIGAQRAYFELNDGEMARNIVLNFFDEQSGKAERDGENATGIHSTTNFTRSSLLASLAKNCTNWAGAYYTLDGRMLAGKPSAPGIYVKDGRKVAIKSAK